MCGTFENFSCTQMLDLVDESDQDAIVLDDGMKIRKILSSLQKQTIRRKVLPS